MRISSGSFPALKATPVVSTNFMMKQFIIFIFLNFAVYMTCKCQTTNKKVVVTEYDTIARLDLQKKIGPIKNRQDSAYINFDGYFNGIITIVVDNNSYAKQMTYDASLGYSGFIAIPKIKKMIIDLKISNSEEYYINFDKRYCTVHVFLSDGQVTWVYTNQIYEYE
jgi:hypothetical protein